MPKTAAPAQSANASLPTLAATVPPLQAVTATHTPAPAPTLLPTQPQSTLPATSQVMTLVPTAEPSLSPTFPPSRTPKPTSTLTSTPPWPTPIPIIPTRNIEKVVLISVDGLRPDAISAGRTPTLWQLLQTGAADLNAQTVNPPETLPSHASLISGVGPDIHGIRFNHFDPNYAGISVPTIFTVLRDNDKRSLLVSGKNKLIHLTSPAAPTNYQRFANDDEIASVAAGLIPSYDFIMIHLPDVDDAGHTRGWMSGPYLEAVQRADAAVATLVRSLDQSRERSTTLLIVTADHGGEGFIHDASIPINTTIPWIINGPSVRQGTRLAGIHIIDTAPTILHVLNLSPAPSMTGRVVAESFQN